MLHHAGNDVTGVDISQEAIDYAKTNYPGPLYECQEASETEGSFDVLVSFETLEHLDDPLEILKIDVPLIICSVPNELKYPFQASHFECDQYPHKRHYTPEQFEDLLESAGFRVSERFCQPTKQGEIQEGTNGRFLIYTAYR